MNLCGRCGLWWQRVCGTSGGFRCAGAECDICASPQRKPVDDIIAFLSEHEEELDSLDIVAADTALYQKIEEQIPLVTKSVYTTSAVSYRLELSHKNSGKATGLAYVLKLLDITPEETVALEMGTMMRRCWSLQDLVWLWKCHRKL